MNPAHGGYPGTVVAAAPVLELTLRARDYSPEAPAALGDWLGRQPHGHTTVRLVLDTRDGKRRLTFGARVHADVDEAALLAVLAEFKRDD